MYDKNYRSDKSPWIRYGNPIIELTKSSVMGGITGFIVGAIATAILWLIGSAVSWTLPDPTVLGLKPFIGYICAGGMAGAGLGLILAPLAQVWWRESFFDRLSSTEDRGEDGMRKRPDSGMFNSNKGTGNKDKIS